MDNREFDVVVVGGGGSGLAAALSSAQHGASVVVLERRPQLGGTTGIAVGSFTAAETRFQQRAQVDDRIEWHVEDAGQFATADIESRNNERLRSFFLSQSADTLHWLADLGLSFFGPSAEPPNRQPRMHNVVPGAKAYITRLQLELQKRRVPICCDAEVTSLIKEGDRVTGVVAQLGGAARTIRAHRGVVLAGGDYANNSELIARFKGEQYRNVEGINPHAQGHAHLLAENVGAELVNMDITYGPELRFVASSRQPFQQWLPTKGIWSSVLAWCANRMPAAMMNWFIKRLLVTWQHPENALFDDGAILINAQGERFVNELLWPQREIAVAQQEGKVAYILLDGRLIRRYAKWPHFVSTAPDIAYAYVQDYLRLRPDVTLQSDSLESLAAARGIGERLTATIRETIEVIRSGRPDAFGRAFASQQDCGPPYVIMGPVKSYFTTTEGGTRVDERLRVHDSTGNPIPGLYAVGQTGLGGMVLFGHGLHIAWAMTSGRLVGEQLGGQTVTDA